MSEMLKPCPFCGSTPKLMQERGGWSVECENRADCIAVLAFCSTEEAAIERWNRRAPSPLEPLARLGKIVVDRLLEGLYTQNLLEEAIDLGLIEEHRDDEDQSVMYVETPAAHACDGRGEA